MTLKKFFGPLMALVFFGAGLASAEAQQDGLYRWTAPATQAQLDADQTAVAPDQGAIFVPAFSNPEDEPEVLVFKGKDRVGAASPGTRIPVAPGTYTVRVGTGAVADMIATEVTVASGATATVEPTWGGLRVEVVDNGNIPHRGTYELIRIDGRVVIGTGYGADTLQAESLQTWILPAGLYRIVRPGETYRARNNFATVDVPAGGLVHFKLVTDPVSGDFQGAGVVDAAEFVVAEGAAEDQVWSKRIVLGGAVSLNTTTDVVGLPNQDVFTGSVFFDSYLTYNNGKHFGTGIFEIEEGLVRVDPETGSALPTQKTQDRLRADVTYTYFINDRFGPYGRFGLLTNLFESNVLVTEDTTVAFNPLTGPRNVVFVPAAGEYKTSGSLGALRIREGAGLNVRLVRNDRVTANWRIGAGLRQNVFNNSFVQLDDPATPELDLFEIDDFNEEGVETTLTATVRLGKSLLYITDLELFGDFGDLGDPTIDWRNTVSYRLNRFASLDYTLDVLKIPQVLDENQVTQNILLRFSFDVL